MNNLSISRKEVYFKIRLARPVLLGLIRTSMDMFATVYIYALTERAKSESVAEPVPEASGGGWFSLASFWGSSTQTKASNRLFAVSPSLISHASASGLSNG